MKPKGSIVSVGIAGLGRAGWGIHAAALRSMADCYRIVAAYDPIAERRAEAVAQVGCRDYSGYADMLADEDVDLVVVATPSYLHTEMAIQALRAGKHVLVEKPFAINGSDADRMIAAAHESGRILCCNQNCRYQQDFRKVREVIKSGKLGAIMLVRIAWHSFSRRWDFQTLKAFGGGTLNNNATHVVDQGLLLLDDLAPEKGFLEVFCSRHHTPLSLGDADNHVKIVMRGSRGPTIDIEVSEAAGYSQDRWLVLGEYGALTGTETRLRWRSFDPKSLPRRQASAEPTPDRTYNQESVAWVEETCTLPEESDPVYSRRLYDDLHLTLRHGAPTPVALEIVRRQIAVLDRCRELNPLPD